MLLPVDVSQNWDVEARCRGGDASLFFGPERFEPKRERLARETAAKEICKGCPALQPCRDYALQSEEAFGVWGGLTGKERERLLEEGVQRRAG